METQASDERAWGGWWGGGGGTAAASVLKRSHLQCFHTHH